MIAGGEELQLPFIDRHSVGVNAHLETTWEALESVLIRSLGSRSSGLAARALGCADTATPDGEPLSEGSTIPGFRVLTSRPSRELKLAGKDHFSRYELIFRLAPTGTGRTELSADTRAVFPGLKGTLFRGLVIGTRAHVLVMRRLLRAVKQRAESRE